MILKSAGDLRYRLPRLTNVEDVEKYRTGGFHPIHLEDVLKAGRYRILHKLGHGGFSTVWLARDKYLDKLVSLKILTAEASRRPKELDLLRHLHENVQAHPGSDNIVAILDNFAIDGPNGTHICYVMQPGGPSLFAISESPGEIAGTRRLRASLARKVARQLAQAVSLMHDAGIVHGDITPKNVLLKLKGINVWSTETIYQQFGPPVTEEIIPFCGQEAIESAPKYLVESASVSSVDFEYLSEQALLIDLGEAFHESSPPTNGVGTPVSYCSPELLMQSKASRASDIWALACTVFETRSGFPLFESFVGSSTEVLEEMVRILGLPPELSHSIWEKNGVSVANQVPSAGITLNNRVREIGMYDEEPLTYDGDDASKNKISLLESPGQTITAVEENDLVDLLRKTLDYTLDQRLSAKEIANHLWCSRSHCH